MGPRRLCNFSASFSLNQPPAFLPGNSSLHRAAKALQVRIDGADRLKSSFDTEAIILAKNLLSASPDEFVD
jgi:hypothetical protein